MAFVAFVFFVANLAFLEAPNNTEGTGQFRTCRSLGIWSLVDSWVIGHKEHKERKWALLDSLRVKC